MVSDLKAQLLQAEEAARLAKEAVEVAVAACFERGVMDTEARLIEEVAVVCRDYITESWGVALDLAAVPADFDLRRIENFFFPEDIREIPSFDPPEELPSAPTTTPNSTILEGKGGNEEMQPSPKDMSPEDALTIRDVVAQAKEVGPKPTVGDDRQLKTLQKAQLKIKLRMIV